MRKGKEEQLHVSFKTKEDLKLYSKLRERKYKRVSRSMGDDLKTMAKKELNI